MTIARQGFVASPEAASRRAVIDILRRLTALEDWQEEIPEGLAYVEEGSYTPTLSGIAVGTGGSASNTAHYTYVGDDTQGVLDAQGHIVFGTSGQTFPVDPVLVALPDGFEFADFVQATELGGLRMVCAGGGYHGATWMHAETTFRLLNLASSGAYVTHGGIGTTTPATWAAGDHFKWHIHVRVIRTPNSLLTEAGDPILTEDGTNLATE